MTDIDMPPADPTPPPAILPPPLPAPKKPRVWPVYANLAIVVVVAFGMQILLGVALVAVYMVQHGASDQSALTDYINDMVVDPRLLVFAGFATQAILLGGAVLPAWFSPEKFRTRLRLCKPRGQPLLLVWVILSGLSISLMFQCAEALCAMHDIPLPTEQLERLGKAIHSASGILAVGVFFVVSIMAPVCEELLCRGYIQSRLERRHGPLIAILVASSFFAFLHFDLLHSAFAFAFGLYIGLVAWRTGSTITGILIHFLNNTLASLGGDINLGSMSQPLVLLVLALAALALATGVFAAFRIKMPKPPLFQFIGFEVEGVGRGAAVHSNG